MPDPDVAQGDDSMVTVEDSTVVPDDVAMHADEGASDADDVTEDVAPVDAALDAPVVYRPVASDIQEHDWHGAWTVNSSEARCGGDEAMVGLVGRAGGNVVALGVRCARVMADGSLSAARTVGPRGGDSASEFVDECPAGEAVVRWDGASGGLVDRLGVTCAPLREWLAHGTLGATLPARGGSGGSSFRDTCAMDRVAHGLDLHTGWWDGTRIFRVRLRCMRIAR